jgi:hypothetical protein
MDISESITIVCDPDVVFAFVADYANDTRWRSGVVEMTPSPRGQAHAGTTVHEVLRFGGRTHVTDTTITDVDGRSLRYEGDGTGGRVRGVRRVEVVAGGARLTTELHVDTDGWLRLCEPVLAPLFRHGTRRDLRTLRRTLEAAADHAIAGSAAATSNAPAAIRR